MLSKKMLRVVLVLFLIIALSFSVNAFFSGGDSGGDGVVEVEFWNLFGGGDADFMDAMIESFNDSQDEIVVKQTRLEFSEYYTGLITAIASGFGPDIAITHISRLEEMANEGLVIELDDTAEEIGLNWSDFNQNILDGALVNDGYYGVPLDTHPQVLYYNKTLLEEADLLAENGEPIIDETPEGFMEFLSKIQAESTARYPMSYWTNFTADGHYRLWWGLYSQLGGSPIVSDDELTIDMDKAIQAAEYMKSIYDNDFTPVNAEYDESVNLFRNQDTAVLLTGVWITGTLENTEELDFGVVPMPKVFENQAVWADSHSLVLPYNDSDPIKEKAALTFAKWLTDNGEMWARAGHIPSKKIIIENESFQNMPYRMDYVEAADFASFDSAGNNTWGIRSEITTALSEYWRDRTTAEEAFTEAVRRIERTLTR
ncbi:ABC transporter substrate-binding protein [Halanaerobium sp. Z-7514]|uniref:ABC transporter substrate-binding protein n=1 Tax=Halanaerobium polyolivorans TaxID=2886943 RepID=A0AAW4X1W8_9FIRM|nr:ABC transporter substrate-binding protein [Halanaerobium polyolivorans]MCC3145739.1 ABC transporter substrate-binding protein [Halanaerobium polyolivorans]RQD77734.1 MAG: ABC transporter substrate-binding protein [Halanaerobium sp. MSAO_Bac5]